MGTGHPRSEGDHPLSAHAASVRRVPTLTAVACAALLRGGDRAKQEFGEKLLEASLEVVLEGRPTAADAEGPIDLYFVYWGTRALRLVGGRDWKTWNAGMQAALLPRQVRGGPDAGSFAPECVWGRAGRVYSTALACLCLESYYWEHPDQADRWW